MPTTTNTKPCPITGAGARVVPIQLEPRLHSGAAGGVAGCAGCPDAVSDWSAQEFCRGYRNGRRSIRYTGISTSGVSISTVQYVLLFFLSPAALSY